VIQDGDVTISESGAIMDYLMGQYGNGALSVSSNVPNFSDYAFWYHWGIGTFQSTTMTLIYIVKAGVEETHPVLQVLKQKITNSLEMMDQRLMQYKWLAGEEFTAADVYAVFIVTTMRLFIPFPLLGYSGIKRWLENVSHRPAYRRMIEKAEQSESRGEVPVLCDEAPRPMASY
jgi:glutathione S-transferase